MINTAALRQIATAGAMLCSDGSMGVVVPAEWLKLAADELDAGRQAQASLDKIDAHVGATFGLPKGRTL